MNTCRARSSGSWSSRSARALSGQGPGSRSATRRAVREHEVDRLADREDLRRLLVGDADRRTGPRAPARACRGRASRPRDPRGSASTRRSRSGSIVELVGEVRADELEDLLAGHCAGTLAGGSDDGRLPQRAPASSSAASVRPTTSSRTPRAATSIARAKPVRVKRPCATTPSAAQPEHVRAAGQLRVDVVAQAAQRAAQQQAAERARAGSPSRRRGSCASACWRRPPSA